MTSALHRIRRAVSGFARTDVPSHAAGLNRRPVESSWPARYPMA
jgi:hypothetical protein